MSALQRVDAAGPSRLEWLRGLNARLAASSAAQMLASERQAAASAVSAGSIDLF